MEFDINSFEDYKREYADSLSDPEKFWDQKATSFVWKKKWEKTSDCDFSDPRNRWFIGGKLNITENCLDRHLSELSDKTAIIWEPNNPLEQAKHFSYKELHLQVCRHANVLKNNGVKKGDRVCFYLPMIPELVFFMLACARIGAIHSVVYAGFSSVALASRIIDTDAELLITSDGAYRGEKLIEMKRISDEAIINCPSVKKVIVVKRTSEKIPFTEERDRWLENEISAVKDSCEAVEMDAEDPLFILYTSGSTGKPKGVVHGCGGYMVFVDYTFRNIFRCRPGDIYWCTADVGWITGHSYLIYGPLLAGVTTVLFEGIPTYPDAGRWWSIIDKNKVNAFYTSPTAIRTLETHGTTILQQYSLDTLKILGSVGEPINETAWQWFHKNIGKERCPIMDTWWQTETGGIAISPLAPVKEQKPGFAMFPMPGIVPVIVNEKGEEMKGNDIEGDLCFSRSWPGLLQTIYKDHARFKKTYFSKYPGLYFSEDGCRRDKDGHYRITGRTDDMIKISGHLLGTAEIENALNRHPLISESAVVAFPHPIKGSSIAAFVIEANHNDEKKLKQEVISQISNTIGAIAKPEKIFFVHDLPKTRSGKIMRRILKKIAEGEKQEFGDTSTLINPSAIKEIIQAYNADGNNS